VLIKPIVEQMNKTTGDHLRHGWSTHRLRRTSRHGKASRVRMAGITLTDSDLRDYVGRSDAVMIEEVGTRYH